MADKQKGDWDFLRERVTLEALKEFNGDAKRAILDLLRSDVPLSPAFRELLADELEKYYYFPASPSQKRKEKRQLQASIIEGKIDLIMELESCSKAEATRKVAEQFMNETGDLADMKLESTSVSDAVEALEQRLKRAKRERDEGYKNF